jgi:thymidylate synthase (FAD)
VAATDVISDNTITVLDHGFVRLDDAMADDLSVANAARVSFARRKDELDEADEGLIRFLMRDRHGTPFEHNAFRFHVRCPIFVAREWFRHRIGCLTGDTVISFVDINGHAPKQHAKSIDELWRMWTVGEREGLRDARSRVCRMRLRVLDESTGAFATGHLTDIIDKGVQPVYTLTLADGKELSVTENHRLLTATGWQRMRAAIGLVGDGDQAEMTRTCSLMTNGTVVDRDREWRAARRREGKSASAIAHRTRETEMAFARVHRHQVGLATDIEAPSRRGFTLTAHPVPVLSIKYIGVRQTYDLSVAGRWHNFVANGVVVHNSFNEFSLRYAKASDDFYLPAPKDVRSQVGKPGAYTFEPVTPELAEQTRADLQAVYEHAFATYERLVEAGVARELARSALPVGAYTQFYWTLNARSLMNFVSLRNSTFAQLEIRRYAEAVETFLAEKMPVTYAAFVANDRIAP